MSKHNYKKLSESLQEQIKADLDAGRLNPHRCEDAAVIRRNMDWDKNSLLRPAFVRDVEKIIHLPYYNRYTDKTQVFSLYKNDDISRRGLHVQLVSRIARNIGRLLGLNLDLIEAIALGHDLGHTPFGHAGEKFLSELLEKETGRAFNHNVQSARILDKLFARNVSLQCLDGVLCHNGEFEMKEYRPEFGKTFDDFDRSVELCYTDGGAAIKTMVPMTLEGCVVRICDMVAYLGKDRQDATTTKLIDQGRSFTTSSIGDTNAQIINNITVDIVENSYGKDHLLLSENVYNDLKTAKKENYAIIYDSAEVSENYEIMREMFGEVYYKLLEDLRTENAKSPIFKHHLDFIENQNKFYKPQSAYNLEEPNQIVTDYMASMTDDYFIELHKHIVPDSKYKLEYVSYFSVANVVSV
ncbi:MAG: HD domain-containing protein [Bacillota bacterium]|nr:HD domain-containing protein [Bacillota bacterium]